MTITTRLALHLDRSMVGIAADADAGATGVAVARPAGRPSEGAV